MPTPSLFLVDEFHRAFDLARPNSPRLPPLTGGERGELLAVAAKMAELGRALKLSAAHHGRRLPLLRLQLCQEELAELAEALVGGDLVGALDALCDMRYVADGATVSLGLSSVFDAAFAEVHRSNMSKLDEDGRPIIGPSGRVVKGPMYKRPNLGKFV